MCHFWVGHGTEPLDFDALYARGHADLVQQTFLLTAGRRRATRAVRRAFGAAAHRWAEIGELPDPAAWVRARAFDAALSPWHCGGPRRTHLWQLPHRRLRVAPLAADPPAGPLPEDRLTDRDRALLRALMRLSRPRRRALVLHDAIGLPAEAVAVEVESSIAAAERRVRAARAALARSVPELVGSDPQAPDFAERLGGLLYRAGAHGCPAPRQSATELVRTTGRARAMVLPAAAGLLVLGTVAVLGSTLAGSGPSTLFAAAAQPHPRPHCATGGASPTDASASASALPSPSGAGCTAAATDTPSAAATDSAGPTTTDSPSPTATDSPSPTTTDSANATATDSAGPAPSDAASAPATDTASAAPSAATPAQEQSP